MTINKYDSEKVAKILLNINAVKLQPYNFFTWSSGKKSPIYCDNRLLLSHVEERNTIVELLCKYIRKEFESIDYIAGVATGAIAHGMMVASKLNLPFVYIRETAKKHGRKNQIEGTLKKNSNVVVVEDLISTGNSSRNAIKAIEAIDSKVIGLTSIFTYEIMINNQIKIPYFALCKYSVLIDIATRNDIISKKEKEILSDWKKNNLNEKF